MSRGMNLADLKLLVDVAWVNRNGQTDYTVSKGLNEAARRLVKAGFLEWNPTAKFVIGITQQGYTVVDGLLSGLEDVARYDRLL